MLPFWISIALLSLVQGVLVALAGSVAAPWITSLRARRWAVVPPLSVIAFVFIAREAERVSAQALTYLALGAVPVLAAVALGWFVYDVPPPRRLRALLVAPLFALAWLDRGGLAGEGAALALSGLSCVALGVLLAAITPPRWLAAGIVTMAVADTALVVSDLLQAPNNALNAAHPVAGLPQLQSAVLGSAVMGYGDLFIAGLLGGLLAASFTRSLQLRAGILTAALALGFDLLFFVVDELPATVPVASALVLVLLRRGLRSVDGAQAPAALQPSSTGSPQPRSPLAR